MAQQKNTWTIIFVVLVIVVIAGGVYWWQTTTREQEELETIELTEIPQDPEMIDESIPAPEPELSGTIEVGGSYFMAKNSEDSFDRYGDYLKTNSETICFQPAQFETANNGSIFCFKNSEEALLKLNCSDEQECYGSGKFIIKDLPLTEPIYKDSFCFQKRNCEINEAVFVEVAEFYVKATEPEITTSPQFETIDEYLTFSLDSAEEFKSSLAPDDFFRLKIDNEDHSIAPKGVDFFNAYVWATSDWDDSDLEDLQTFYIETIQFDLMKEEEGVSIMETAYSTWYGPFQGKLKSLMQ